MRRAAISASSCFLTKGVGEIKPRLKGRPSWIRDADDAVLVIEVQTAG